MVAFRNVVMGWQLPVFVVPHNTSQVNQQHGVMLLCQHVQVGGTSRRYK